LFALTTPKVVTVANQECAAFKVPLALKLSSFLRNLAEHEGLGANQPVLSNGSPFKRIAAEGNKSPDSSK
jgi:hypothetical protein